MSLETSTYINGLVVTNPTSSDPVSRGDDHLKLLKSTIKNTFPNVTGAITTTHVEINLLNDATHLAVNNALVRRSGSGAALFSTVSATTLTGTLSTAAQTNITSVGALGGGSISSNFGNINNGGSSIQTTGTITSGRSVIDSVVIDGSSMGHSSDPDLLTFTSGDVAVAGTVDGVDIGVLNTALTSGNKSDARVANILSNVYPVGSVYMSLTQSASPAALFGGVWSAIGAGRVLMGHGEGTDINGATHTAAVGSADTTGEYTHVLTNGEMPKHDHVPNRDATGTYNRLLKQHPSNIGTQKEADTTVNEPYLFRAEMIEEEGNDLPHNNVQPHLAVYMWKRDS